MVYGGVFDLLLTIQYFSINQLTHNLLSFDRFFNFLMKNKDSGSKTQSSSIAPTSNLSWQSSSNSKYNGLIEEGYVKKTRKELYSVFSYIYSMAPNYEVLHNIVFYFRILQFFGPSFFFGNSFLWINGTIDQKTASLLTFSFHFLNINWKIEHSSLILLIYSLIILLFIFAIIQASKYYKAKANLPKYVIVLLSGFMSTLGHLIHPLAADVLFSQIGRLSHTELFFSVPILVLSIPFLLMAFFLYIQIVIMNQSLQIQPSSFMSLTSLSENIFTIITITINAIHGYSCQGGEKFLMILIGCIILMYLFALFIPFISGGFIKQSTNIDIVSCSLTGISNSILITIWFIKQKKLSIEIIFFSIVLFLFFRLVVSRLSNMLFLRRLDVLDDLLNNIEDFQKKITSPNLFVNIVKAGISIAHPIVIDFSIFEPAIELWPMNQYIWLVYAKLVAIYPELTQKLIWIYQTIWSYKIKGIASKTIKNEASNIIRQRESNLSSTLKEKITTINHLIQSAKLKLRHSWDIVIQGNTREVENSCISVYESIQRVETEIKHLFQQYPNNKFVTRVYSRFLLELKADVSGSNDMTEKTRLLSRGCNISTDRSHELGILAFALLPEKLQDNKREKSLTNDIGQISINDADSEDEGTMNTIENNTIIKNLIDDVIIPSISMIRFIQTIMFLLVVSLIIGGIIYVRMLILEFREPLPYIYNIANMRTYTFQMVTFTHRYVYQILGYMSISNRINGDPPVSLGYSWSIKSQLEYILGAATSCIQRVNDFRSFSGDDQIERAKTTIFGKNVDYLYYTTPENPSSTLLDLQQSAINIVVQLSNLVENGNSFNKSIINTSAILNPIRNVGTITNFMNNALNELINSIYTSGARINATCLFIKYSSIILSIFILLALLYIQIIMIQNDKSVVAKSLTLLPKNVVSNLVEHMKLLKHDESGSSSTKDSDMNRQEENILKVLSMGNTIRSSLGDLSGITMGTISLSIMLLLTLLLFNDLLESENSLLINSAPHLDYITGSYALTLGSLLSICALSIQRTDVRLIPFTEEGLLMNYKYRVNLSEYYYHMARYGGQRKGELPFEAFAEGLEEATKKVGCSNRMSFPTTLYEISDCFSPDLLMTEIFPGLEARLSPYLDYNLSISPADRMFTALFDLLIDPIYDTFLYPMFEKIIPTITRVMDQLFSMEISIGYIIAGVSLLVEILIHIQISTIDMHIRLVLGMLMHCPTNIVLSSNKIMSILSGDFSEKGSDTTTRDSQFFNNLNALLPDSIIICNNEEIIQFANNACLEMFKLSEDMIIGKQLSVLFREYNINESIHEMIQKIQNSKEVTIIMKGNNADKYLGVFTFINGNTRVFSLRDISRNIKYNSLIKEERQKSDSMLEVILPASLVKRVKNNEKNISFAVQSSSIVFIDIVSFTPWCSSNPASVVMFILNQLFKKFDSLISKYPTMNKIKCIGDCYMAAGGIFSEVNQPSVHAKEAVCFGLDAMDAVNELNSENNQNLQIRIGINTGGPIVGGVLGVGKPTFEILGSAINMAQQMEHNGLPMKLQVSRPVYELIYGDNFLIKERGEVDTKTGPIIAYIVSRK